MSKEKEIKITKCIFKPEFIGKHISYVNINGVKPKYVTHEELKEAIDKAPFVTPKQLKEAIDNAPFVTPKQLKEAIKEAIDNAPFVTHEELKVILANELAKKPVWFDLAMTEALAPIVKRMDQNGLKPLQVS